jgi:hypothetical protein
MERWAGSGQNIRVSSTGQADLAGCEGTQNYYCLAWFESAPSDHDI